MSPAELADLDLIVAQAEGMSAFIHHGKCRAMPPGGGAHYDFSPTRDRTEAMLLLEKYRMELYPATLIWGVNVWHDRKGKVSAEGNTPAIAICRGVLALKS